MKVRLILFLLTSFALLSNPAFSQETPATSPEVQLSETKEKSADKNKETPTKSVTSDEASKKLLEAVKRSKAKKKKPKKVKKLPKYLQSPRKNVSNKDWEKDIFAGVKRVYAVLNIKVGDKDLTPVKIKLFHRQVPETVKNFIGLAEGLKTWYLNGRAMIDKPLYNGVIFHRVIRGFMIQTGDPSGGKNGNIGVKVKDEFHYGLKHDKPGIVSMANAGPNTGSSQFFITVSKQEHLDKRHSVFGEVVSGYNTVEKISKARTDRFDKPRKDIIIKSVEIIKEK